MAVIHISETEAVRDFAGVLAQVRAGAEVVIEAGALPVAVLRPAPERRGRLLSECIALAEAHEKEARQVPAMDSTFVADMEEIVRSRRPRSSSWI